MCSDNVLFFVTKSKWIESFRNFQTIQNMAHYRPITFMFINMFNIVIDIIIVYEKGTDLKYLHIDTSQIWITF